MNSGSDLVHHQLSTPALQVVCVSRTVHARQQCQRRRLPAGASQPDSTAAAVGPGPCPRRAVPPCASGSEAASAAHGWSAPRAAKRSFWPRAAPCCHARCANGQAPSCCVLSTRRLACSARLQPASVWVCGCAAVRSAARPPSAAADSAAATRAHARTCRRRTAGRRALQRAESSAAAQAARPQLFACTAAAATRTSRTCAAAWHAVAANCRRERWRAGGRSAELARCAAKQLTPPRPAR